MNYKQTSDTVTVQKWQRAKSASIVNNYGAVPSLTFNEEILTLLPDGTKYASDLPDLPVFLTDPTKALPIIDPTTGNATGASATYGDLFALIYSLYILEATARDAAAGA